MTPTAKSKVETSEAKKYFFFVLYLFFLGFWLVGQSFFSLGVKLLFFQLVFFTVSMIFISLVDVRLMFFLLVFLLPFENTPLFSFLGFSLRPFQLAGAITFIFLLLNWLLKRPSIELLSFSKICIFCKIFGKSCSLKGKAFGSFDRLVFLLPFLAFISGIFSPLEKAIVLKGALVFTSFIVLYWIFRNFLEDDLARKRVSFFIFLGSVPVLTSGLIQAFLIKAGNNNFTVMSERINATFTEPDWFGIYLSVLVGFLLWLRFYFLTTKNNIKIASFWLNNLLLKIIWVWLFIVFFEVILTVSRSAWLGVVAVILFYFILFFSNKSFGDKNFIKVIWKEFFLVFGAGILAFTLVSVFDFSSFHLFNRLESSFSGFQKITISCPEKTTVPSQIKTMEELTHWQCRHIRLEEIETEKAKGREILSIYRPDPNIETRKSIYQKTWEAIKKNPLWGWGIGSAGLILGKDERGAGLNSSNIFLEAFLSLGFVGGLIFSFLLLAPLWKSVSRVMRETFSIDKNNKKCYNLKCRLTLLLLVSFLVPNIFNSGILLAIFWLLLGLWMSFLVGAED